MAWHSAATYAAAAVDPSCFRGLQFPEPDGPLAGFATRIAGSCGVDGRLLAEAERTLGARILAVDGNINLSRDAMLASRAELLVYGAVGGLQNSARHERSTLTRPTFARWVRSLWRPGRRQPPRPNPILAHLALAASAIFLLGTWYFHSAFNGSWLDSIYFVVATMTTTGYGDLTPNRNNPNDIFAAMLLMLSGITLTGLFIAFGASLLTRVHWVTMQGLRPVHRRGHIIICGAGSIGAGVIDLLALGKRDWWLSKSPPTAPSSNRRASSASIF